jgi:hypothetical protein
MLHRASDSEEVRLQELRILRKSLWRRFEDNPNLIHLAARLKVIDDQIAQRNRQSDQHDTYKIEDSEAAEVPKVGGLFLVLAVSQRRET